MRIVRAQNQGCQSTCPKKPTPCKLVVVPCWANKGFRLLGRYQQHLGDCAENSRMLTPRLPYRLEEQTRPVYPTPETFL